MKKTFQKTLIAAAAGVALMSAVGTASANSLLFPYFTTEAGNTSIVTLATNNGATAAGETLHYVYNYGSACTHYDGNGRMTNNDLLQHTVASTAAGGFGKVVATDTSTPFYFPLKDYGFLTVTTRTGVAAKISGDMVISNPTVGIVTSYPAIDNGILNTTVPAGNEGNFNNITDSLFNLSFYPTSLVTTSWYGVVVGDMSGAIVANTNWAGVSTLSNGGLVYDNDEAQFSGVKTKAITCAGTVLPSDLMTTAQQAAVGTNGGLIHATATAGTAATSGLVLTKIQVITPTKAGLLHREQAPAF